MLKVGNTDISNIYHGSIAIRKAYVGSNLVWPSSPPVPYDAEVEWIETDGVASYINTGINSSANLSLEIDCQLMSKHDVQATPNAALFGARGYFGVIAGMRFAYILSTTSGRNLMCFRTPSTSTTEGPQNDYGRHVVRITPTTCAIDNISLTVTSPVQPTTTYLGNPFCLGRDGTIDVTESSMLQIFANARFYSARLFANSILVFEGIPVKVGNDGCIFDQVSGRVISNSGGGRIIPGPDKN